MSPEALFSLRERVAIITGGAGLLGSKHAEVIAEAGGNPVIVDTHADAAERISCDLTGRLHVDAMAVCADVTQPDQVERMVEEVHSRFGRIDILINNAALTVKSGSETLRGYFAPFEQYPLELWERALRSNLTSMFLCTQAVGRVMVQQKRGVVVNMASTAGVVAPDHRIYEGIANRYGPEPFNTPIAYTTTKAGVLGFTRYLATYWAPHHIRVNALSPGGVYDQHDERFVQNYSFRVPMARMAQHDEYKGAILFLCSDASSYMTGGNLIVDGGLTAW